MTFPNLLPPYTKQVWAGIVCVGILVLLGLVLLGIDRCSSYRANKSIAGAKQQLNASLTNLAQAQANVANDNVAIAVAVEDVKHATNTYLDAANASESARAVTNQALANVAAAANANRPVGTTGEDLKRQLDNLNIP